ncbi:MAG: cation:proton antiporter, partial [Myxococcota bacterium]
MHGHSFIADVAAVLAVAGVTGALARRFNQPSIVAYLLAGFVVGPYIPIPLFADAERVEALAEFGVVLVMFAVGLEFSIAKLLKVLPVSGLTGLVQVGFLAWCGFSTGALLGFDAVSSTFLAGAVAISSTMVVTKTFAEHPPPEAVRSHVLGILVIQDVLAIVIIAVLTGVAAGEGLAAGPLLLVFTKLLAVLALLLGVGLAVVPRAVRWLGGFGSSELMVVSVIGLCFALGHIAELLGYSVALGAFVAGILVAESGDAEPIEHQVAPLRDVFAAVFFVSVGMSFDPGTALTWVPAGVLLAAVVIAGHLFAVTLGGVLTGGGLRRSVASALALGQIGELAFIIAGVGISAGAVPRHLQPILLIVALITSFTTPIAIRHSEDVARWLDHRLPGSVHRLLGLYEQWFARLQKRTGPAQAEPRSRLLRALRLV